MKKTKLLYVALATPFLLSGCASKEEIKFPFDASDVNFIEIYHYSVPGDAQEKAVVEMEDVETLYDSFSGQTISQGNPEDDMAGGTTTSFRFNLSDGTDYEVVYTYGGGKSGTICFLTDEKEYVTAADIEALWKECDSEPRDVHESRLPGDPCGLAMKPIAGTGLMPGHYIAQGYDKYLEPTIDLYADKKATLFYSTLSSDLPMGEFTIEDGTLVLQDEMFDKKYTFVIDGKDLIFQADKSAEIPRLEENTLRDGTRFVYQAEN